MDFRILRMTSYRGCVVYIIGFETQTIYAVHYIQSIFVYWDLKVGTVWSNPVINFYNCKKAK